MKRKALITMALIITGFVFFAACNDDKKPSEESTTNTTEATEQEEVHGTEIKPGEVELKTPLDRDWVSRGKAFYELKCQSCHKLTNERLVGPGWKDVTKRRKPEWILNMITNVDMMLETDPEAQKLLEQCLVRMPNQNLSRDEARYVLEFMRLNDGEK